MRQQGLVSVLQELHAELDRVVLAAYGWSDLAQRQGEPDKAGLLTLLLALNARRAIEEAQGQIRWLRPEFQNPQPILSKQELPRKALLGLEVDLAGNSQMAIARAFRHPQRKSAAPQPATLPEQVRAVAQVLASASAPLQLSEIEASFQGRGGWKKSLPVLLQTLEAMGRAQPVVIQDATAWRA